MNNETENNDRPEQALTTSTGSVLLVGGTNDGRWINKPQNTRIRMVPIRPIYYMPIASSEVSFASYEYEEYQATPFRAGNEQWHIFILVGLKVEQAFQMLLDGYSPKQ